MQNVDVTSLNGFFKNRYDKFKDAVPDFYKVGRMIPFSQADRTGDEFIVDVMLRLPQGHTYAAGSVAGTVYNLNDPIALETAPAKVKAQEFVLRVMAAYGVLSRSQTNEMAFGRVWDRVIAAMRKAGMFHEELCFLYGSDHIGQIDGAEVSGGGTATQVFKITQATWAPGVWAMAEGMKVDVYDTALTTKRNATTDITVSFSNTGSVTAGRRLTLTGLTAELDAIVDTDKIVPKGAITNGWMVGIKKALTTITGNLFNISTTTYGLWSPTNIAVGGVPLTFTKILEAAGAGTVRGLEGKATVLTSTYAWIDLSSDMSALRSIVSEQDGEQVRIGAKKITFIGPNGELEMVPHSMVMAGDTHILQEDDWERPGSTPFTFELPGKPAEAPAEFFQHVPGKSGMECQGYWDQALICHGVANQIYLSGIVPRSVPT